MRPVLCAGRLYCDLVFTGATTLPKMGTEVFADGLSLHAGGGAFITAATISALGSQAALLASYPAAPFDQVVAADIQHAKVDARLCEPAKAAAAPQLTVAMTGPKDRAFLTHRTGDAFPQITLSQGQWSHLHIGELRSLVEHPELTRQARSAGMSISLDCGWDDALLSAGAQHADLISQVDVFLPNEDEYDLLRRSGMAGDVAGIVVVKCGGKGAYALHAGEKLVHQSKPVPVVDATGAGDAFNGGFLVKWLSGAPISDCLDNGHRCGAATVGHIGGTGGLAHLGRGV